MHLRAHGKQSFEIDFKRNVPPPAISCDFIQRIQIKRRFHVLIDIVIFIHVTDCKKQVYNIRKLKKSIKMNGDKKSLRMTKDL